MKPKYLEYLQTKELTDKISSLETSLKEAIEERDRLREENQSLKRFSRNDHDVIECLNKEIANLREDKQDLSKVGAELIIKFNKLISQREKAIEEIKKLNGGLFAPAEAGSYTTAYNSGFNEACEQVLTILSPKEKDAEKLCEYCGVKRQQYDKLCEECSAYLGQ